MSDIALSFDRVIKSYKKDIVLDGIDLSVING